MKSFVRLTLLTTNLATTALLTGCGIDFFSTSQEVGYRTGQEVRNVPQSAQTETLNGSRYYTHDGTYYRPRNGSYVAVEPAL